MRLLGDFKEMTKNDIQNNKNLMQANNRNILEIYDNNS